MNIARQRERRALAGQPLTHARILARASRGLLAHARSERLPNLPVMAEGIDDPADEPAMFLPNGPDLPGTSSAGLSEQAFGIRRDQDEAGRAAIEGFWTVVAVCR